LVVSFVLLVIHRPQPNRSLGFAILANKASNGDLVRSLRVMAEKETRLEQAIRHVAETKRSITEQRQRIETLRASGISTLDAEQTLDVLYSTLRLLENHEKYVREHLKKWN
jgi:hypothetical protein